MKSIKVFFRLLLVMGIVILSAIIGIIIFLWLDDEMYCLDIGKIYDPIQKICRDDCLTWNKTEGCVPITKENMEKKAKELL